MLSSHSSSASRIRLRILLAVLYCGERDSTACAPALMADAVLGPAEFVPLPTPAAYAELLANVAPDEISVVKFQSPNCRSCRQPSAKLQHLTEAHPHATFYTLDLVINGKAAGRHMKAFFAENGVKEIPYVQVYRGQTLLEAGPDRSFLSNSGEERCLVTSSAVACVENEGADDATLRPLQRLRGA